MQGQRQLSREVAGDDRAHRDVDALPDKTISTGHQDKSRDLPQCFIVGDRIVITMPPRANHVSRAFNHLRSELEQWSQFAFRAVVHL